ncbi:MAG: hypothetical protein NC041_08020 [Bacteroides sp.]|nr:hypothetical protein [Prevotella sp.]MCM1408370.1 MBOAT family protein [Treponema brennaborense]MCM1470399.1 hypothetical protein [Bacteroides sp.]
MLFPTYSFLFFFAAVFIGFWYVFRGSRERKKFLIAASFVFYACFDIRYAVLLAVFCAANYCFLLLVYSSRSTPDGRRFTAVAVVFNLLLLCYFKYYNFFADSMNGIIRYLARFGTAAKESSPPQIFYFPYISVALPVGISFYIFKTISLLCDVSSGKLAEKPSLADTLLYISFFPQIASGPIEHASVFLPQIDKAVGAGGTAGRRSIDFSTASMLIMSGLLKKMIFANFLSVLFVDAVFSDPAKYYGWEVFLAGIAYAAVIYCDFSGYSDMAAGTALLLGFETSKNFDRPYSAFSVSEFWRRWHITLSSWLKKYVYFALGGSRAGFARALTALMITMLVSGLWHGASWVFVLWGAMQGAAMIFERCAGLAKSRPASVPAVILRTGGTFLFTAAGWVVFRSETLADAQKWFCSLTNTAKDVLAAGRTAESPLTWLVIVLLAAGLGIHFIPDFIRSHCMTAWRRVPLVLKSVCIACFFLALSAVSMSGVAPFIYFSF